MLTIKIFGKQGCDACKSTKEKFDVFLSHWEKKDAAKVEFYDLDTVEGLTEGSMVGATDVPTTIIEQDGKEMVRWEKQVPLSKDFKQYFA
jgi:glutaredoxin